MLKKVEKDIERLLWWDSFPAAVSKSNKRGAHVKKIADGGNDA